MIFGIGLSKTGTTSLFAALDQLGYRSATYRHLRRLGLDEWFEGNFERDYLAGYDAATDLPLAQFFPQLDLRYPCSKFVLTVRDLDSWLESARNHFTRPPATSFGRQVRLAHVRDHRLRRGTVPVRLRDPLAQRDVVLRRPCRATPDT